MLSCEQELLNKYPSLFQQYLRGRRFECGDGWENIIKHLLRTLNYISNVGSVKVDVIQIKEKFGSLRVYVEVSDGMWQGMVDECVKVAELMSRVVCETCGKQGLLSIRGGWFRTRCPDCLDDV